MEKNQNERSWLRIKITLPVLLVALLSLLSIFQVIPVHADTGSGCQAGSSCVFFPSIVKGAITGFSKDLVLQSIEVTQAVQDAQNSVPLVTGRPAVMRIYTSAVGFSEAVQNVKISISAVRASETLQSRIQVEGSPDTFTATVPLTNNRADYSSTINFPLPESWLTGAYDLTVVLNPDSSIPETSKANNRLSIHLSFNQVPELNVTIVPIRYTHTLTGHTYPAPTVDTISEWLMRIYPVSKVVVNWHAPYAFSGDLRTTTDFNRLLNEITTLKTSEGVPSEQVYYGLVPTQDGAASWFYGGIAGIGWIGSRTSVGVDSPGNTAQVAGHEIGHNLGMLHTPCGVNGDPNYPYAGGSIGQYGLDVFTNNVYTPSSSKDMMSYCNPRWISDYTYKFLYNSQMATAQTSTVQMAAAAGPARGMLVRATIAGSQVDLQPTYILQGQPVGQLEKGDYTVQILGARGDVIFQSAVQAYKVEDNGSAEGSSIYGINTVVPLPDQPATAMRLLKGDTVLAEQNIQVVTAHLPMAAAAVKSADGLSVRWGSSDRPVLVRYSTDGGKTWSTLATDIKNGQMNIAANTQISSGGIFDVIPANTWK